MKSLTVHQYAVGGFDTNFSYLVADDAASEAMLVDPSGDVAAVTGDAASRGYAVTGILVTHTHFDHIEKLDDVLTKHDVPVYVHENGAEKIDTGRIQTLADSDTVSIGVGAITVMHTPGHIDDAVCYYLPGEEAADGVPKVISGDTLFVSRVGKTNKRDVGDLWKSVQRLMRLPDETEVYPGHDYGAQPVSTIGAQKRENPYLRAADFGEFKRLRLG